MVNKYQEVTSQYLLPPPVSRRLAEFDGGRRRHAGRPGERSSDPDGEGARLRDATGSCKVTRT